jgi:hypothetical protein
MDRSAHIIKFISQFAWICPGVDENYDTFVYMRVFPFIQCMPYHLNHYYTFLFYGASRVNEVSKSRTDTTR